MIKTFLKKILNYYSNEYKIMKLHNKSKKINNKYIAKKYNDLIYKKYKCCIGINSNIGTNLKIPHPVGIVIGEKVVIGENCTIYQNVTIGQKNNKYPKIGNNVTIYAGAVVIGDIAIGNNVIIGANAVVTKDVPDNCVVAGVPAKIIKRCD